MTKLILLACLCVAFGAQADLRSFPTRRSSDLELEGGGGGLVGLVGVGGGPGRAGEAHLGGGVLGVLLGLLAGGGELAERSEEHTSELQSREKFVGRLLREKKNSPREGALKETI